MAIIYITDTLGCMILGSSAESVSILRAYVAEQGAAGSCSLIGSKEFCSSSFAALVNGTAAHAYDLDDVGSGGHSSAIMLAAGLAAAEEVSASGEKLLQAFCIGMEVGGKVDSVLMSNGGKHYEKGWHNTSTSSAVGAAACCAALYNLTEVQTAHAIAHAANLSCGLRKSFGSMSKHVNAGNAAYTGLMSAKLALKGFRSQLDMLDGPNGFFECFSDVYDDSALQQIGQTWSLLSPRIQKLFPSCGFSHRGICAILDHYNDLPHDPNTIKKIIISLPDKESSPLPHTNPQTGTEGSFSAEYTVAAALLDGFVGLDSFSDEMVQRPEIRDLITKTQRNVFEGPPYSGIETITIETFDGTCHTADCENFSGGFNRPLSTKQLQTKFIDCASRGISANAENIYQMTMSLVSLSDIHTLTEAIRKVALY